MANTNQVLRGTGVRALWKPGPTDGTQHVQIFEFHNVPHGASFTIWCDGVEISTVFDSTIATMQTFIKNSLEATDSLAGISNWSVVGSGSTFTATCAVPNVFFQIRVTQPSSGRILTSISKAGAQEFTLFGAMASFQFSESIETIDVTPVMQLEEDTLVKKSVLTFAFDLYDTDDTWQYALYPGVTGLLTVQEEYGMPDTKYFAFNALIEGVEKNTDGVLEYNITGRRKGPMVSPLGSRY